MTRYEEVLLMAALGNPVQPDTQDATDSYEARELMQADDDGMFKQGE